MEREKGGKKGGEGEKEMIRDEKNGRHTAVLHSSSSTCFNKETQNCRRKYKKKKKGGMGD